jgi:hypothetical protein
MAQSIGGNVRTGSQGTAVVLGVSIGASFRIDIRDVCSHTPTYAIFKLRNLRLEQLKKVKEGK